MSLFEAFNSRWQQQQQQKENKKRTERKTTAEPEPEAAPKEKRKKNRNRRNDSLLKNEKGVSAAECETKWRLKLLQKYNIFKA